LATNITLDDLVEAIANAVVRAQDQVERHQTSLLRAYFDGDGRPLSVKLRVQSLRDDSDEFGEEILVAPLIALVGRTTLSIKELEISTKVTLGDLSEIARAGKPADSESAGGAQGDTDANTPDPFPNLGATGLNSVRLDLGATEQTPRTATAELKLKVVAQEPTEGMARLLVELNKRIVAYPKPT
jgi:hypothetical protein